MAANRPADERNEIGPKWFPEGQASPRWSRRSSPGTERRGRRHPTPCSSSCSSARSAQRSPWAGMISCRAGLGAVRSPALRLWSRALGRGWNPSNVRRRRSLSGHTWSQSGRKVEGSVTPSMDSWGGTATRARSATQSPESASCGMRGRPPRRLSCRRGAG